ncbi:hypothetical protein ACERK3_07495 [Phycisphaerales bacterium AB-hyl4]|uniref:Uncharacterized protein n=1 Tax=Natronomicrosphaera hydrolytica TaxID=3242702 RepID=A0ABV4U3G2_9BACT
MRNPQLLTLVTLTVALSATLALSGCGEANEREAETPASPALPATLFLADAPAGEPQDIAVLAAEAVDGQEVVLQGRIGGRREPFVANRAVMVLTDVNAVTCHAAGDVGCSTPWDYCCVPREQLQGKVASVQVVDETGQPLRTSLQAGGLEPLTQVIVQGVARREAGGDALIIDATNIYVER